MNACLSGATNYTTYPVEVVSSFPVSLIRIRFPTSWNFMVLTILVDSQASLKLECYSTMLECILWIFLKKTQESSWKCKKTQDCLNCVPIEAWLEAVAWTQNYSTARLLLNWQKKFSKLNWIFLIDIMINQL